MAWNLEEALAYYRKQGAPSDQNALKQLLREAQEESGGFIPKWLPDTIARCYGIRESLVLALIRRTPSLRLGDGHTLELCAGPNCGKHAALAAFAESLAGRCEVRFVPCMRLCGKGPNLKWDGKLYHRADEALLKRLMEEEG